MKKTIFISTVVMASLVLSGCSVTTRTNKTQQEDLNNLGIYKSTNKGESWAQKVLMPTITGRPGSIGNKNVKFIEMDPSDKNALYIGTAGTGAYFTYDAANSWYFIGDLGNFDPTSIAVDPNDKCTIYVANANKVLKSEDCSRSWEQIYFDSKQDVLVTDIAVDHFVSSNIYIGTSRGELVKSSNYGESWQTISRFSKGVASIYMDPIDSRILFVNLMNNLGVRRTRDAGVTWEDMRENLKDFKRSNELRDFSFVSTKPGLIFMATFYGLLKTEDYGDTWTEIELIPPEKNSRVNAIAVNQENPDEIFYVTHTAFYRSLDGGQSWNTNKLPTTASGVDLLLDPEDSNIIYLAARKFN